MRCRLGVLMGCLCACAATAAAHTNAFAAPNSSQTRDTIVRHAGAPKHPGLGRLEVVATIGSADGTDEYLFDEIAGVLFARNGDVWIADGGLLGTKTTPKLRMYDGAGRFLRAVGRRGMGPGEFQIPGGLAQCPDGRVVLRDQAVHNRLNVYSADGRASATWTFAGLYPSGPVSFAPMCDSSGVTWLRTSKSPFVQSRDGYVRIAPSGKVIDTVPRPMLPSVLPPGMTARPPYWPRVLDFASPHGYFVTTITSSYAIDLLPAATATGGARGMPRGAQVISIRRDVRPVTLTEAERRDQTDYLKDLLRRQPGAKSVEVPRTKPPIRFLYIADDGRFWVHVSVASVPHTPPRGTTSRRALVPWRVPNVFDVFEPDGAYVGQVQFPDDTFLHMSIRGDTVVAALRIADGVNIVRRYRVVWP